MQVVYTRPIWLNSLNQYEEEKHSSFTPEPQALAKPTQKIA